MGSPLSCGMPCVGVPGAVTVDLWDLRTQKPMRTRYLEVGRIEDGENMSDMSM